MQSERDARKEAHSFSPGTCSNMRCKPFRARPPSRDAGPLRLGADLLGVRGTYVFDSFHEGWNELHPIEKCTIVGRFNATRSTDLERLRTLFAR
jgi:hypothetical protein